MPDKLLSFIKVIGVKYGLGFSLLLEDSFEMDVFHDKMSTLKLFQELSKNNRMTV